MHREYMNYIGPIIEGYVSMYHKNKRCLIIIVTPIRVYQ